MRLLSRKNLTLWIAFSIYAIVTGVLSLRHTMWRDELQLWLVGFKSSSFSDLIVNSSHDIHPMGYFIFTWIVSHLTSNPEALKVTNWVFSLAMAVTVLFGLKMKNRSRLFFLFGFIPLIGYSHIAEQYMLCTFLYLLLVKFYMESQSKIHFYLVAGVLANLHILFFLASFSLVIGYSIKSISGSERYQNFVASNKKVICCIIFYFAASLLAISRISPSVSSSKISSNQNLIYVTKRGLLILGQACFPFFEFATGVNTQQLVAFPLIILSSTIFLYLLYCALKQKITDGLPFVLSNFVLLLGMSVGYSSYWWHFGVLYLCIFGSIIGLTNASSTNSTDNHRLTTVAGILLLSQIIALFIGPRINLWERQPYSNAKNTAAYLKQNCDSSCTIIMDYHSTGASISGYLNGRDIFYVNINEFGSFTKWNRQTRDVNWELIISAAKKFPRSLIVTGESLSPPTSVRTLRVYSGAVWSDENFVVSELAP